MKFNFSSVFLPGVITTTTNALDYEVASDVILYVKVCDSQGAPNCLSATALVYVSVTDVNEYAPQFLQVHPLYISRLHNALNILLTMPNTNQRDCQPKRSVS